MANVAIKSNEFCRSSESSLIVLDVSYDTVRLTPTISTIHLIVRAGRPFSNPRHDELTMMAWWLNGKSGSGSLLSGKDLTNVSEVTLAPAGLPVGYMDPVTRHIQGTPRPAYKDYNQYVQNLNLPLSVASSPAYRARMSAAGD